MFPGGFVPNLILTPHVYVIHWINLNVKTDKRISPSEVESPPALPTRIVRVVNDVLLRFPFGVDFTFPSCKLSTVLLLPIMDANVVEQPNHLRVTTTLFRTGVVICEMVDIDTVGIEPTRIHLSIEPARESPRSPFRELGTLPTPISSFVPISSLRRTRKDSAATLI